MHIFICMYEWDPAKEKQNIEKHDVSFEEAKLVFHDKSRLIFEDEEHSQEEMRWFCLGKVGDEVMTVRFTMRGKKIRIIGAAYWRKGRKIYENENRKH